MTVNELSSINSVKMFLFLVRNSFSLCFPESAASVCLATHFLVVLRYIVQKALRFTLSIYGRLWVTCAEVSYSSFLAPVR